MMQPEVTTIAYPWRGKTAYAVKVHTPHHEVEVGVSPEGRSVRVFVDGKPFVAALTGEDDQ